MPTISEMTLEQLQDYALNLEGERDGLNERVTSLNAQIEDLYKVNRELQDRNNYLFTRVEQSQKPMEPTPEDPAPVESCEDFARNLIYKGV